MARRLGLPLYHFTFFTQQLIAFPPQAMACRRFLHRALCCLTARANLLQQETRFSDKFAFGNVQFDNTLAEHRIRAELHQILTGNQVIDLSLRSPSG